MAGGDFNFNDLSDVEILPKMADCQLTKLPKGISGSPTMFQHGNNILLCGGYNNEQECLKYDGNAWTSFNSLTEYRTYAAVVPMKNVTYMLGGSDSQETSEMLKENSNAWHQGPSIPKPGLDSGCAVRISDHEILVIGGFQTDSRILKLNTYDHTWSSPSIQLHQGRSFHSCIVFNDKVIITGGYDDYGANHLISTEIIEIGKDVLTVRNGGNLMKRRRNHGMGIVILDNVPTVIAFGGRNSVEYIDTVEIWNDDSESWATSSSITLEQSKREFGFASVSTELLCP